MSEQYIVGSGMQVTMHFVLSFAENNHVIESTRLENQPVSFVVGDGSLVPGFEKAIEGLKAGESHREVLSAADAYGERDVDNVHPVSLAQFADDIEISEGVIIEFTTPTGDAVPGTVRGVEDGQVIVDFNHPLSGYDLSIEVEVLEVKPAAEVH